MEKTKTLKQIFYLLLIGIFLGVFKVEFFITFIDGELTQRTRIISYITLGFSSIFFYFIILLAVLSSYLTVDIIKLGSNFKINNFYKSINYFIWFLMINEFFKTLVTFLTFDGMPNISTKEEFNSVFYENHLWIQLINFSDILFISLGSIAYIINLKRNDTNVSYLESIVSSIPLFLSFIIFRMI